MVALLTTLERSLVSMTVQHTPTVILLILVLILLAVIITIKSNAAINRVREEQKKSDIDRKQISKLVHTLSCCPCISKTNGLWLQDIKRNGGNPPEKIVCVYISTKEKDKKNRE